jgi:hypothetical protein
MTTRPFNLGEAPSDKTIMMPATTPNVGDALLVSDTPDGRVQLAFSPPPGAATIRRFIRNKTANYTIVFDDLSATIRFTGAAAATLTLPSPAVVGDGWWCVIQHAGTGTTAAAKKLTITRAVGLIDGLTSFVVYPGDTRTITSDGVNFYSTLIHGGFLEINDTDSPFSFVAPTGARVVDFELWGGGGSGGSGRKGAEGALRIGGSAGGGGSYVPYSVPFASIAGLTGTVTVAQRVNGGAPRTTDDGNGSVGLVGQNTTVSFGVPGFTLSAYGGGRGQGGFNGVVAEGGGGAGVLSAGLSTPGLVGSPAGLLNASGQFGGGSIGLNGAHGLGSGWGGAGGGGSGLTFSGIGGSSLKGGPGGGGGGGRMAANTNNGGGNGGGHANESGGGGALGAANTPGTDGLLSDASGVGWGGGGGGAGELTPGKGGDGGVAAGGGGGGAAINGAGIPSGAGGRGGPGRVRITYSP